MSREASDVAELSRQKATLPTNVATLRAATLCVQESGHEHVRRSRTGRSNSRTPRHISGELKQLSSLRNAATSTQSAAERGRTVYDSFSRFNILVDTGTEVSVLPVPRPNKPLT